MRWSRVAREGRFVVTCVDAEQCSATDKLAWITSSPEVFSEKIVMNPCNYKFLAPCPQLRSRSILIWCAIMWRVDYTCFSEQLFATKPSKASLKVGCCYSSTFGKWRTHGDLFCASTTSTSTAFFEPHVLIRLLCQGKNVQLAASQSRCFLVKFCAGRLPAHK